MTLEAKLADIRAAGAKRIPEEMRKVMGAATKAQRESGVLDRTIQVGDQLPPFALKDHNGDEVTSQDLLSQGAVVLTVFRGHW